MQIILFLSFLSCFNAIITQNDTRIYIFLSRNFSTEFWEILLKIRKKYVYIWGKKNNLSFSFFLSQRTFSCLKLKHHKILVEWKLQNFLPHALPLHYWHCWQSSIFRNFVRPNQTSLGRVSVNSLCQQIRLFALNVNR